MSIIGLDTARVANAYQTVLKTADDCAWLLLEYVSRDELTIRDHGSGEIHQFKAGIAAYSDKSPLYGVFYHCGQKIVFKYVPTGTSRLLQARTAVHFQAVVDHFSPADATYGLTDPDEITNDFLRLTSHVQDESARSEQSPSQASRKSLEREVHIQSSNIEVSHILSRLKAIREGRVATTNQEEGKAITPVERTSNGDLARPVIDVPPLSRGNSFSNNSHTTEYLGEEVERMEQTLPAEQWLTPRESGEFAFQTWKPKVKPFPRPATDEKAKKLQAAASIRQRLPSGLRIGLRKPRTTSGESPKSIHSSYIADGLRGPSVPFLSRSQPPKSPQSCPTMIDPLANKSKVPPRPTPDVRVSSKPESADGNVILRQFSGSVSQRHIEAARPLTLERQRLMRALSIRNKYLREPLDLRVTPTDSARYDVESGTGCGRQYSNTDSGIDVECGEDSASDGESSTVKTLHLRRRRAHVGKAGFTVSTPMDTNPMNMIRTPTQSRHLVAGAAKTEVDARSFRKIECQRNPSVMGTDRGSMTNLHVPRAPYHENGTSTVDIHADEYGYESSSSSDSLLEELQGAILQEARRISIATSHGVKTGTPNDSIPSPYSITSVIIRTGSNHSRTTSAANSNSTGYAFTPQAVNVVEQSQIVRKGNLSSRLSKRVQTLNEISRATMTVDDIEKDPYSSFLIPRQASTQRLELRRSESAYTNEPRSLASKAHNSKSDQSDMTAKSFSNFDTSNELRRSSIQFEHPGHGDIHKKSNNRSKRPASLNLAQFTSNRLPFASASRRSMESNVMHFGRSSSEQKQATPLGFVHSNTNLHSPDEIADTKRETRASRMMKRFSSGFSITPRQPLVEVSEHPMTETLHDVPMDTAISIPMPFPSAIGELNVQFPDTLLWKRRWVEIDISGYLVLGATKVNERISSPPKKYHMSEFKAPLVPCHDRQEMPDSILLDFNHGGTLQLACDDTPSQVQVLEWLSSLHNHCSI